MKITRRCAVAGLSAAAVAPSLPAFAQSFEEKGYVIGDVPMGDENAPVTIIEYASLTCPHCAAFHQTNWEPLKTDFIETGKARFIMREIYFDQFGLWGAMLARSAGEMNYHRMIDMLLSRQQEWYQAHVRAYQQTKNPRPIVDSLMQIGRLTGMSNQRMTESLQDAAFLEKLVADYKEYAEADNVRSTPSFLINGDMVTGNMSPIAFAEEINKRS
ncbi:MAG: DsbA family protein [Paracoccaceae bacterium]|nr:DsbA family protein [Paracoccaceae bacterium]